MTDHLIWYIIIGIVGLLSVFAFVVGIEKMIKIILGNYILGSICLAATQSIDLLIHFLETSPELKFAGITYKNFSTFFVQGKTSIVLIIYVFLLAIIYKNSKIHVKLPEDLALQKGLSFLFVPLTVLSMILTLQIAIIGIDISSILQVSNLAKELSYVPILYTFLKMTPVWIFLHGIATILITSEFKIGIKTGI